MQNGSNLPGVMNEGYMTVTDWQIARVSLPHLSLYFLIPLRSSGHVVIQSYRGIRRGCVICWVYYESSSPLNGTVNYYSYFLSLRLLIFSLEMGVLTKQRWEIQADLYLQLYTNQLSHPLVSISRILHATFRNLFYDYHISRLKCLTLWSTARWLITDWSDISD